MSKTGMWIKKYPEEDLAIISTGNTSVPVSLSKLQKELADPELLVFKLSSHKDKAGR